MSRTIAILQPGYLPWLGFFEQMDAADVFVLYDDVQFSKGAWANRNRIKGPNGPQWLTVPVCKKPLAKVIGDVQVSDPVWKRKHVEELHACYSKAPYFESMSGILRVIEDAGDSLCFLTERLIALLRNYLGVYTRLIRSSVLDVHNDDPTQRLVDICRHFDANRYYCGASSRNYLDETPFAAAGIEVAYQDDCWAHPTYPQRFGSFVSHLSVVDLLFNCGPASLTILRSGRTT